MRTAVCLLILAALLSCRSEFLKKKTKTVPPQPVKPASAQQTAAKKMWIPLANPFGVDETFCIEEQASTELKSTQTGMRGDEARSHVVESHTAWTARLLRVPKEISFLDYSCDETVREGKTLDEASNSARDIDNPRQVAVARFNSALQIDALILPVPPPTAADTRFAARWNLITALEGVLSGNQFEQGKDVAVDPALYEQLFELPFSIPIERFKSIREPKHVRTFKMTVADVTEAQATFDFTISWKSEAYLGKIDRNSSGTIFADAKTGRIQGLTVESTYAFSENRFYEAIDAAWTAYTTLAVGPGMHEEAPGPYTISAKPAVGDKIYAARYAESPEVALKNTPPGSSVDPKIEYVQEYFLAGENLNAKRRYLRSATQNRKVDAVEGKVFVADLGKSTGPLTCDFVEGQSDLFPFMGKDDLCYGWLPPGEVRVGDCWTSTGICTADKLVEGEPFAVLAAVFIAEDSQTKAQILVFTKSPCPWESEAQTQAGVLSLIVNMTTGRVVQIEQLGGYSATLFYPIATIDWAEPTATDRKIEKIKRDVAEGGSLYAMGQTEAAMEKYRETMRDIQLMPEKFEPELTGMLQNVCESDEGTLAVAIAAAQFRADQTEARFSTVLHCEYMCHDWTDLASDSQMYIENLSERPDGYLYDGISKVNQKKYKESLASFETADSRVNDSDANAAEIRARIKYFTGKAKLNMGLFGQAKELVKSAMELYPKGDALPRWKRTENQEMLDLLSNIMEAEKLKIYISFKAPEYLPLGMYHLMSERYGPLPPFIDLQIINGSSEDRIISVSSEVVDVTYVSTDQVLVPAVAQSSEGGAPFNMRVYQTPPLRKDFNVNSISEEIERPIRIVVKEKLEGGEKLLIERTIPVVLWPRKRLILTKFDKESPGGSVATERAIAAWVTPRSPFIDRIITDAKKLLPKGVEFLGGAAVKEYATKDQVRVLYDFLKSRGMSYVAHTSGINKWCFFQDIRLPYEVFKSTNSLCVEGTVLFASLLEGIGLQPVIVLVPGHAYVGWHDPAGPVHSKIGNLFMLETTSVGRHDYDFALQFAEDEFERVRYYIENLVSPDYQMLDISRLRSGGYKPQPYPEE